MIILQQENQRHSERNNKILDAKAFAAILRENFGGKSFWYNLLWSISAHTVTDDTSFEKMVPKDQSGTSMTNVLVL